MEIFIVYPLSYVVGILNECLIIQNKQSKAFKTSDFDLEVYECMDRLTDLNKKKRAKKVNLLKLVHVTAEYLITCTDRVDYG